MTESTYMYCTVHYNCLTCLTYIPKEWEFRDQQVPCLHVISDFLQGLCIKPPPPLPLCPLSLWYWGGGVEVCPPDRVLHSQSCNKFNNNGVINTAWIEVDHVKLLGSVQHSTHIHYLNMLNMSDTYI